MPSQTTDSSSHDALFTWVQHQGGYLNHKVELSQSAETGFCIRVKPDTSITQDTLIARCPTTATLSVLNALDAPGFACHGTLFPSAFLELNNFIVQCFFLVDQYLHGSKSYWNLFFQTLPKPSQIGEYTPFEREDREWLEGTNLASALQQRLHQWRRDFDVGLGLLRSDGWKRATDGSYTWDLFRWAAMVFSSRGFSSAVLVETYAADVARPIGRDQPEHLTLQKVFDETFAVLIPVLDMLNYRPVFQVEWQANVDHVGLQVLENLDPGQEVCNNYGPKDNEELILGYGFAIDSNPFDSYIVGFSVPPGSPLEAARRQRRISCSSTETKDHQEPMTKYHYQIFNPSHPASKNATNLLRAVFSYDLLDAISILSANVRELDSDTFREQQTFMTTVSSERIGRLTLNTAAQLLVECQAKAQHLRLTDPNRKNKEPVNRMQRYSKLYRDSQLRIVELAATVCKYCLDLGRGLQPPGLPEQAFMDLVQRAPLTGAKLFNFESLLQEFWGTLSEPIKMITEAVCGAVSNGPITKASPPNVPRAKLEYMIILYIARSGRGSIINTPRSTAWIESMVKWYPISSTELCSPTEEFARVLETIMEAEADTDSLHSAYKEIGDWVLQQSEGEWDEVWWDPEKLCWSWNVVDEEGVQIPGGPYLLFIPLP